MKTLKTILFAALLLFTANAAMAQDKYEYAVMYYNQLERVIYFSATGKEVKKIEIDKKEAVNGSIKFILKEVDLLQDEGWEVMEIDGMGYTFYLKKKVS